MGNKNIENAGQDAKALFLKGFNCAESSLLAVCGALEIKSDSAPKVATGFGGGVSRFGGICGALSGTVMAMGLIEGRKDPKDNEAKINLYRMGAELLNEFKTEYGTVDCRDLIGFDLQTEEGLAKFISEKFHEKVCPKFVEFAVLKGIEILKKK